MGKKHKKICTTLNYIQRFLILASTVTGWISISAFASSLGILGILGTLGITSSEIGLKFCAVTARIKKCTSIINNKKTT